MATRGGLLALALTVPLIAGGAGVAPPGQLTATTSLPARTHPTHVRSPKSELNKMPWRSGSAS